MTEIIYIGRRKLTNGKPGLLFITVEKLQTLLNGAPRGYYKADTIDRWASAFAEVKKTSFPKIIGGILETDHDLKIDDAGTIHSINYSKLKFVRMSDSEMLANWRTMDDALEQEKRVNSAIKRAEENTDLARAVATLKRHYANVSPGYRRSFQLWLLNELDKR